MKLLKRILKDEAGQALPMALILLVLGGLLVVPALNLTATNLTANRIVKQNTLELYSADAGVADALWQLNYGGLALPPAGSPTQWTLPETVNNGTVNVTLSQVSAKLYKIVSTATLPGGSTTVEALVQLGGNPWFFDNAITSANDIYIWSNCNITGKVIYTNNKYIKESAIVTPAPIKDQNVPDRWPDAAEVDTFFYNLVRSEPPYTSGILNIPSSYTEANPYLIPPVNRSGDLSITGTGYAKLNGTVYVTGNLSITDPVNLNLNKKTVFAKGTINIQKGYIYGAGCVVALETVIFKPNSRTATSDDYVFIMSVNGTVQIYPCGKMNGSMAGWNVDFQPNVELKLTTPPSDGLDFPSYFTYIQRTYTIK